MSGGLLAGAVRGLRHVGTLFVVFCVFGLMILTTLDVIGRYFLNAPLPGAFELTELLMPAMIFGALPQVTAQGRHIVVDIAGFLVPARGRRIQHAVTHLLSALVLAAIVPGLWDKSVQMMSYGETTATLDLPVVPIAILITAMTALTSGAFALLAFRPPADG